MLLMLAVAQPSQWGIADLAIVAGVALLVVRELLDLTGRLPSSKRLRSENADLVRMNGEKDDRIQKLEQKVEALESEVRTLKQTDVSALFSFMKQHDEEMKIFVPQVVGALEDVRSALQALTSEIQHIERRAAA